MAKIDAGRGAPGFLRLRIEHLWVGIPVFLLTCKAFLFPLPLLDFWWHLKAGELIVSTGSIPRTDLFSFTAAGKTFVLQNWLAEVIYYLTYDVGGEPLVIALNTALLVSALVPVYLVCLQTAPGRRLAAASASLTALGLVSNVRPQVFSFVLFAIFFWVLSEFRDGRRSRLWTLPLLTILWSNLHGAFVVGLGLICIFILGDAVRLLLFIPERDRSANRRVKMMALTLLFCLAATLVNPEGYRIYEYLYTVMMDSSSQQMVIEWQAPAINTIQGALLFYLPFFLTLCILLYGRRAEPTDLFLFVGFSAFALTAARNSAWFILVAGPLIARYAGSVEWASVTERFRATKPEAARQNGSAQENRRVRAPRYGLNLAIAASALAVVIMCSPWIQPRLYGTSLLDRGTPVAAMDFIERHRLEGNIFHPQVYGDYLIWRLWPMQRSFFDGRVHLFGEEFVRAYRQVFHDSCWEQIIAGHQIRYLLLNKDGDDQQGSQRLMKSAAASISWVLRYEDGLSALYERVAIARQQ